MFASLIFTVTFLSKGDILIRNKFILKEEITLEVAIPFLKLNTSLEPLLTESIYLSIYLYNAVSALITII